MTHRHIFKTAVLSAVLLAGGCSAYDDSALWNDVDKIYNDLTAVAGEIESTNAQLQMLSAVVCGGVITDISSDAEGKYTISWKGEDNVEHTVMVATKDDVLDAPLLGTKEVDGILYWTMTYNGKTDYLTDVDGSKIPVSGRVPEFSVDKDGYWLLNGRLLKDASGNPIKSEGKGMSLISDVNPGEETVTFILSDGSPVEVPRFGAFGIVLKSEGIPLTGGLFTMDDSSSLTAELTYEITGKNSAETTVKVMKSVNLEVSLTASAITLRWESGFEEGSFTLIAADTQDNVLVKNIRVVAADVAPQYRGIKTADDWQKFVTAVNTGSSLDRFRDTDGSIVLLSDVDFSGVSSIVPAGTAEAPFSDIFDGKGFALKNLSVSFDLSATAYCGIFGYGSNATIRNLTVGSEGSTIVADGSASTATGIRTVAGVLGYSDACTVENCTNNCAVTTGKLTNTASGSTGIQVAGVVGFLKGSDNVKNCVNNGHIAAPAGRGGGIVATANASSCTIDACTNNGLVEDDVIGQFNGAETTGVKRMGGIAGGNAGVISSCVNNGNVRTYLKSRTGGFVGHNTGTIQNCTNNGVISGEMSSNGEHGPGWACGYSNQKSKVTGNIGYGKVGDTPSMYTNALAYKVSTYFDTEENSVDWTLDEYYEWTETESRSLNPAATYHHYSCTFVPRHIHILEIDMTSPSVEVTAAFADDIIPNPNANGNSNNGFNIRETLSQLCVRKRTGGQDIIAGINAGFFDSNDGIARGPHIEDGELVYANNSSVRASLGNHNWAFTVFSDGTSSCGKKTFGGSASGPVGKVKAAGQEYDIYSVNDTILRHSSNTVNIYTSRYKETPHEAYPSITNPLAADVLYVTAKYSSGKPLVNQGYADAVVTGIYDGRTAPLAKAPYLTDPLEVGIAFPVSSAPEVASALQVNDVISVRTDMTVGGLTKPILTQCSTMYQFMVDGADASNTASSGSTNITTHDPVTFATVNQENTKVWLIEVDGRQDWYSMGLKSYEMYRIAKKVGGYNMTRFDGGGSSTMWVYDSASASGSVVNSVSDSKGERSCMNYILLRAK
ncbi:MAG: PL29 family lyase N-terminal domain-containing protein [Candidatus Cryptobacteroides sp.]